MNRPTKIQPVAREVIGNQLLSVLDDNARVAIMADEVDLEILISAMRRVPYEGLHREKRRNLLDGLRQLQAAVFSEPRKAD